MSDGKLDKSIAYLSGAMEAANDHGVGWRRKFIDLCRKENLNINFIDPTKKPGESIGNSEDKIHQIEMQKNGRFKELQDFVKTYRKLDLRYVDISDFLVAVISPNLHMCGSYDEIFTAERQRKPMFFVCEGGLYNLPRWLFGLVNVQPENGNRCNVFEKIEDVIEELKLINSGEIKMNNQWVLIRNLLDSN